MSLTDFNDLHVKAGMKEVRRQLLACLSAGPIPPESSAPPDNVVALPVLTLERALQRFAMAMPDGKIWDDQEKHLLKKTAARDMMGKKLFEAWKEHEKRRTIPQESVRSAAQAARMRGEGALTKALRRYVYLYPSSEAWDKEKRLRVPLTSLKHAIADCYDDWIKCDRRAQIDLENLVFDPKQQVDPKTHINTFRGLPLKPKRNDAACESIAHLVRHVCNGRDDIVRWLLQWLAYPLQNVGSKMATAVLMHSDMQGSGKSLFFEEVVKPIYGEYGSTLGQHQLESQYTDWRSQLLYGLFEEIFSRDQKYSHTGTLKHMITGKTQRIEKKFVSGWEEHNYMNAVFLSNEVQPFPVEPTDRRMLVVWPEKKMPPGLKESVLQEIRSGGIEAFYALLLGYPLDGFGTHVEPPVTDEKDRLIEFGRASWEVFYRDWLDGYLDVPLMPCLVEQLFKVFRRWCGSRDEHKLSMTKFSGFLATKHEIRRRRDIHYDVGQSTRKGVFFIPNQPVDQFRQGPEEKQGAWLGRCVQEMNAMLNAGRDPS